MYRSGRGNLAPRHSAFPPQHPVGHFAPGLGYLPFPSQRSSGFYQPRPVHFVPAPAFPPPRVIKPVPIFGHHSTRRSYSRWLPALPSKLFFNDISALTISNYWINKVHALLGANWFAKQFRKLFGLNDLINNLKDDYLNIANRSDANPWQIRFTEVYEKTTGFFGGIKRFLMGLSFFKSRSEAFRTAFVELENTINQSKFIADAQKFNNQAQKLFDDYNALRSQVNDTPIETTVTENVCLRVTPVLMHGPRGTAHVRPILRPQGRTYITKQIDPEVISAQHNYNESRENFCRALQSLKQKYPHIMDEKQRQGDFPQKPPKISL